MSDELFTEEKLRDYLLGKVTSEQELAEIENSLFTNAALINQLEIVEDELIQDYLENQLVGEELEKFETLFLNQPERRQKIRLLQALRREAVQAGSENFEKKSRFAFLRTRLLTPQFAGVFLILCVISICFYWLYFRNDPTAEALADLSKIYETGRPVEARITDFEYSPFIALRGEKKEKKSDVTRQRIEKQLLEAVEKDPGEKNHYALGVFYLTERQFEKAIGQFESSLEYNSAKAEIYSSLGAAYFEQAKRLESDKKLENLAKALEQNTKAAELDQNNLEALFNRALIIEEMNLPRKAIEAWQLYLQKDADSRWAEEARRHLGSLQNEKSGASKSRETIREDFLNSLREKNEAAAWKLQSQTKEISTFRMLPYQFARNYLEAMENGQAEQAKESLSALNFIGDLEKNKSADFFFADLADFYARANKSELDTLLEAHKHLEKGLDGIGIADYKNALTNFEKSRETFAGVKNIWEVGIAEIWIAHCLTRLGSVNASSDLLRNLSENARSKNYKWLEATAVEWMGTNFVLQNEYSKSIEIRKKAFKISVDTADTFLQQKILTGIAEVNGYIGETSEALINISKSLETEDFYYVSERQTWRNYIYASQIFNRMNFPDAAIAFGEENLSLSQEIFPGTPIIHNSYVSLAQMYKGKKNFEKALMYAEKSREAAKNQEETPSKKILLIKTELETGEIKRGLGSCEEAIQNYDRAIGNLAELGQQTLHLYQAYKGKLICLQTLNRSDSFEVELRKIIEIFERHRTQILEEQARNVFFDNEQTVYDMAIEFAQAKADWLAAFEYAESSKARSLLDLMSGKGEVSGQKLNFIATVEPLRLNEIQSKMPAGAQLVEFSVLPDKLLAWVITKENFYPIKIEIEQKILEQKIEEYLSALEKERENPSAAKEKSAGLYKILITPILPKINKDKEIYFVPDKALNGLSFAALFSEETQRYLIEDYPVAYSPSASVFIVATEHALQKTSPHPEKLFAVGNPAFNREENQNLADLRSAQKEADQIAGIYPQSVKLTGKNAVKSAVLKNLGESEIFHFAGHFLANKTIPMHSKFLLAGSKNEPDGELKVFEIAAQKNSKLKLAVLSACETGIEKYYNGEGAVGVARFFLAIGVPTTVASFWQVESNATADLMTDFHNFRKNEKLPTIKALQRAQIKAIQSPNAATHSPFFWAGFAGVGGFTHY